MENQEKKNLPDTNNDIDLGTVLTIMGRGLSKVGNYIRQFFTGIINGILFALIFLKKRMWWILGALVLGFSWGTYQNNKTGTRYYSMMTARYNFNSTKSLYSTVEYLGSLASEGRIDELSKVLGISKEEAAALKSFSVEPVTNEKEVTDLYTDRFLLQDRGMRTDTFWSRVLSYKEFKSNLIKFDYPLQEVTVVSTRLDIFQKIQKGFVNAVASNGDLQKNLVLYRKMQQDDQAAIIASLHGLDTLQAVYNERLRKAGKDEVLSTSINVNDKATPRPNPEIEVFEKVMEINDKLKTTRKIQINNQDIVQVYASFNPVGRRVNILRQGAFTSALQALVLLFVIFLIIEFYKTISYYEKKQKAE